MGPRRTKENGNVVDEKKMELKWVEKKMGLRAMKENETEVNERKWDCGGREKMGLRRMKKMEIK